MEWYRSKRKRGHMAEIAVIVLIAAVAVAVGMKIFGIGPFYQPDVSVPSWVTQEFLTPNEYSRPQTPLGKVKNIVIILFSIRRKYLFVPDAHPVRPCAPWSMMGR